MSKAVAVKISDTVKTGLKRILEDGVSLVKGKTSDLVGVSGRIESFSCTILEGAEWDKKRAEMQKKDAAKFAFMDNMKFNVSGSIKIGDKIAYLNSSLLAMLLQAKVLESTNEGYIPTNALIKVHTDKIEIIKTAPQEPTTMVDNF